jgi:hypothetical protein
LILILIVDDFCAQLLANAQAAAVAENNKVGSSLFSLII